MRPQRALKRTAGRAGTVAAVMVAMGVTIALAEMYLVRDGEPQAQIVIGTNVAPVVHWAARELQTNVWKMSGALLPIVTAPEAGGTRVFVGRSRYTDERGMDVQDLEHGAFRMASGKDWLALIGRDREWEPQGLMKLATDPEAWRAPEGQSIYDHPLWKRWDKITGEHWGLPFSQLWKQYNSTLGMWAQDERGTYNAVVAFLRMQGMRWYMADELGEIVPDLKTIVLPAIDRTVRPDFELRYPYLYGWRFGQGGGILERTLWQMRMGFSQAPDVLGVGYRAHGIAHIIARPEVKEEHLDYYAQIGGRRITSGRFSRHGVPCLSSPSLIDANVRWARAMFDVFDMPMVSVMPVDGFTSVCQCELCQGKAQPERGWKGQYSDYVWSYIDRVARDVYKTHPDRKIVGLAYTTYMLPPTNIETMSPNLVVSIAQGRVGFGQNETNHQFFQELREAWLAKLPGAGKRLYEYEYYRYAVPGKGYQFTPAFSPRAIAGDLRDLKGISYGDYIEVHTQHARVITGLNMYVTGRYWWDADQDINALLEEFYTLFYGPARDEMKAFIEYAEQNWMDLKKVEKIDKVFELLEAAQHKAPEGSLYARRIQLTADYIAPLKDRRVQLLQPRDLVPRAVLVARDDAEITLDGKLDEPAWQNLRTYPLRDLRTGKFTAIKSRFHLFWAKGALYMGIVCEEPDMANLTVSTQVNDDTSIWSGDEVEILVETQVHSYYQICINPAAALLDINHDNGYKTIWSSNAEIGVDRGEDRWTLEVRIPVASEEQLNIDANNGLPGRMPSNAYPWYFNVCRQRVRGDTQWHWAFSPTGAGFQKPRKFAELGGIIRDPEERARRTKEREEWLKMWE